ncbi:unnamed protein product [Triticum turgidum subsp. durum]|uniref:Rho GDP-dissociation inhibitor 1 n=1 Tax=Triticum turgidum subsp. durum TaxID=4567 RepID=A0A9R0R7X8_TRITD|nr:unnamed protein product [Triticum turgidum subsp. durum]
MGFPLTKVELKSHSRNNPNPNPAAAEQKSPSPSLFLPHKSINPSINHAARFQVQDSILLLCRGGEGREEEAIQGGNMDQQEEEASVSVSVSVPSSLHLEEEEEEEEEEQDEEEEDQQDMAPVKMALGPQVPLKDLLHLHKEEEEGEDESLRRWKEQLLGPDAVHTTNLLHALGAETVEPEVTILNLTILAPGRPDLLLPIPFVPDDKGHAFALKDGCAYSFRFSFAVSNNIVSGLKYSHTVWKTGVKVENQKVMLGTFSPQQEPYTYKAEEDSTPSGIFARGSYSARLKFVDDDGKVYLDMRYSFEIRKDWPN